MYISSIQNRLKKGEEKGFSLIEVLVSLSIFTVVVTISISALLVLINANARARNSQAIITNVSFALDSMTREIRTGTDYFCVNTSSADLPVDGSSTSDCLKGGNFFSFNEGGQSLTSNTPNDSRRISYRFNEGVVQRRLGNGNGSGSDDQDADWQDITSSDIVINRFQFYVSGTTRADDETPFVTIYLAGTAGSDADNKTEFNIQTSITQYLLDI